MCRWSWLSSFSPHTREEESRTADALIAGEVGYVPPTLTETDPPEGTVTVRVAPYATGSAHRNFSCTFAEYDANSRVVASVRIAIRYLPATR